MTAPYERVYVEQAVGQNRDRVKKLENADTLATRTPLGVADTITGDIVYEDDGSVPTGYVFLGIADLVQEAVVNAWTKFYAVGGWTPGTGTQFLVPMTMTPAVAISGELIPLGFGVALDFSGGVQTPIYFRMSTLSPDGIHTYLEAVVAADGTLVGPGNPYTWATGDIIWTGAFAYPVDPPEIAP